MSGPAKFHLKLHHRANVQRRYFLQNKRMANLLVFIQTNISRKEKFRYISEKCEIFANIDIRHSRTFSCRPPLRRFFWLFLETSRGKRANYCICQDNLEPLAFLVVVLVWCCLSCVRTVCACVSGNKAPDNRQQGKHDVGSRKLGPVLSASLHRGVALVRHRLPSCAHKQ